MIKKVPKSKQIRDYIAKNPKAKSADVAKELGVSNAYVSTVMWTAKKKAGGMAKKKAMTNKASNWKQLGLFSSDIPFYEDSVTDTTPKRMAQLAYEAGKSKAEVDKYWKAVGEVQKAGLSAARIAELTVQAGKPKARMEGNRGDPVNNPAHYTIGGIETIDFIEAKKLNYRLGNVIKYLTRADHKGNKLEDLKKAQWYLEREIESLS
jgi:hypothetical protein